MKFKNHYLLTLGIILVCSSVQSQNNMTNDESAGLCVGLMLIGTNQYKFPAKDWDAQSKKVFLKHSPTFQRINPLMQKCLQGDDKKFFACLAKLSTKGDRDFYTGINTGIGVADKAFAQGGFDLLKMMGGIHCSGVR